MNLKGRVLGISILKDVIENLKKRGSRYNLFFSSYESANSLAYMISSGGIVIGMKRAKRWQCSSESRSQYDGKKKVDSPVLFPLKSLL